MTLGEKALWGKYDPDAGRDCLEFKEPAKIEISRHQQSHQEIYGNFQSGLQNLQNTPAPLRGMLGGLGLCAGLSGYLGKL